MAREVVHDHEVAGAQLRNEDLLDVGLEGVAADRSAEDEGGDHAARREAGDEGRRLPVSVRKAHAQPFAARAATVGPHHVGLRPGLVDEHQALGIEIGLAIEPGPSSPQDVRALLLGGVRCLFLRVMR